MELISTETIRVYVVYPSFRDGTVITSRHLHFQVKFTFLIHFYEADYVVLRHSTEPCLLDRSRRPSFTASVQLNLSQFLNYEDAFEAMEEQLRGSGVAEHQIQSVMESALLSARKLMKKMPPHHNVLDVSYSVMSFLERTFYENRLFGEMEEDMIMITTSGAGMVPASDSSIESLEMIRTIKNDGQDCSCSICLEDFTAAATTESSSSWVRMPCLHIFHGECIKRWLKTSHYCPICRFEMPVD